MNFDYPKPLRFRPNNTRKPVMPDKDRRYLFSGAVVVEEKMDGKQLIVEGRRYVFCAEDLWKRHSISYAVPARFMVFDMFDLENGYFLPPDEKHEAVLHYMKNAKALPEQLSCGVFPARTLRHGRFELEDIEKMVELPSPYAIEGRMEGLVVKPARALFYDEHLSGKVIREEFEKGIKEHHMRKPAEFNVINPRVEIQ